MSAAEADEGTLCTPGFWAACTLLVPVTWLELLTVSGLVYLWIALACVVSMIERPQTRPVSFAVLCSLFVLGVADQLPSVPLYPSELYAIVGGP